MAHATLRSQPEGVGHDGRRGRTPAASARRSATVIVTAVVAALVAWALLRLLGVSPVVGRGGDAIAVTTVDVVAATVTAGLAAWATSAVLRRSRRPTWWPFVGSTALAVSVIGPSWLSDGVSGAALIGMHVVVGIVLIGGFARVRPSGT
jgi:hypothetical protein